MIICNLIHFNYDNLQNKPQINQVELDGNKELSELGLKEMTNSEIEKLLKWRIKIWQKLKL